MPENHDQAQHGVRTPLENTPARVWDAAAPIDSPLCLHRPHVLWDWVDYNGHMSESCYLLVFGDNSDAFFRYIGIDESYRDQGGHSLYTAQTHIHYVKEVAQGEPLRLTLQLLDLDPRRIHMIHSMHHAGSGDLLCTGEQMLVHVDMAKGRASAMPDFLYARLQSILQAHSTLPVPSQVGRPMGIRRAS
jgi:acyl-CoA thioesterase FadM